MRKNIVFLAMTVLVAAFPATLVAFPACDNFGQDWDITLGPFGAVFPGSLVVTGCRDCDGSLGCDGAIELDGLATGTSGPSGALVVFSMTAYDDSADADGCVSTHWNGKLSGLTVAGDVSNELGPFGPFTLALGASCDNGPAPSADPARRGN